MIRVITKAFTRAITYVRQHTQVVFVLLLLFIMPLLFLYSGQQFLEVGRANQDRLQKDRVGLLQDAFTSLVLVHESSDELIQTEIERIAVLNPDIEGFSVAKSEGGDIIPVAALDTDTIGKPEEETDLYRSAAVRVDESLIFEAQTPVGRMWYAYRAFENQQGELYFITTDFDLSTIDDLFALRERRAYYSLSIIYLFIAMLAYWHVRLTDYRYLYSKAQKQIKTKDVFTNMIAHELRAPLTAIRGYASMLEESSLDDTQKTYTQRIRQSSERLIALVGDLLDVARLQSGKLTAEKKPVDISQIIVRTIEELNISSKEKNIALSQTGTDKQHMINGDEKRLQQALTNLVSNAIKYTKQGGIELSVEEKALAVEVRVKDTGMGISAQDQKQLFAPFYRVQSEAVDKITGTGLGMWITKQLVELMGATIEVESIKGVGTHIVLIFPKDSKSS